MIGTFYSAPSPGEDPFVQIGDEAVPVRNNHVLCPGFGHEAVIIDYAGVATLPLDTYRQQHRGGRGVTGMDTKEGDYIEHLFVCSSHDYLLFFSNRGKVYRSKVYELPEMGRTARGRALVNFLPLREGERINAVLSTRDFTEGRFLVFATRQGVIKKTEFLKYNTPIKADGIIAINIRDDDELVAVPSKRPRPRPRSCRGPAPS